MPAGVAASMFQSGNGSTSNMALVMHHYAIGLDADGLWTIKGNASEVKISKERARVLEVLKSADDAMASSKIAIIAGFETNSVKQLLFKMRKKDEVVRTKNGRYTHPDRTELVSSNGDGAK